ncbi:hypothetical protein [Bradyrhizobium genosp. A]|uniref:hypothetical protein n=1 Tax=Bradyrhizobium genosp. A TaxID=83626 RepID=UPI003CE953C0
MTPATVSSAEHSQAGGETMKTIGNDREQSSSELLAAMGLTDEQNDLLQSYVKARLREAVEKAAKEIDQRRAARDARKAAAR